mmetsp:Transcript_12415/g.37878  ORF Transcript_12415/g.37878 Transcript_12415/m.37878 type:complete len:256 (+) Transcript_12415:246-1013(+)|eukprot:CAMPEP_0198724908 /NCGR_PEP_ID=MMETSP1475-20131203/2299_1 /TAXON_ID= ORGANISM="Unidentified sp., Strain CCMP1999" /NCGR_SAMPLE_ID=MMETSP1475 /ASSEMBLY_ACC=CAM_ASM_001111 /LENGTH=255 /DNA_ID=CAMNT_0044486547 /DNA_START=219 /DNA_END=986 /DNA_ORIENTATION=+
MGKDENDSKGAFKSVNSSKSGPRETKELSVGKHPLQLYSMGTPNGQKVTIMLEEIGAKYDAWMINIFKGEQFWSGFVELNPNSKIPAMVDRDGADGTEVTLFESGAILLYLAEKFNTLVPSDPVEKAQCMSYLFFQVGSAPFFGQFGHFWKYAPEKIEYAIDRYKDETMRLLDVLDKRLDGREYLVGNQYTVADIAWFPWIRVFNSYYKPESFGIKDYKNLSAWLERISERPAVEKGLKINGFEEGSIENYHSDE